MTHGKLYTSRTEVDDGICCNGFPQNTGSKDQMGQTESKKIRAETYKNVSKNIVEGDIEGVNHGRKIILPATYYGSVRWYRLKTQNPWQL